MKNDYGILIYKKPFQDNSLLIRVLSSKHGIVSGIAKHVNSKKQYSNIYELGNLVDFRWFGRENSLGVISSSLRRSYATIFSLSSDKLKIINMITLLLDVLFKDNMLLQSDLLEYLISVLEALMQLNNKQESLMLYLDTEQAIIEHSGYRNDMFLTKEICNKHISDILSSCNISDNVAKKITSQRSLLINALKT